MVIQHVKDDATTLMWLLENTDSALTDIAEQITAAAARIAGLREKIDQAQAALEEHEQKVSALAEVLASADTRLRLARTAASVGGATDVPAAQAEQEEARQAWEVAQLQGDTLSTTTRVRTGKIEKEIVAAEASLAELQGRQRDLQDLLGETKGKLGLARHREIVEDAEAFRGRLVEVKEQLAALRHDFEVKEWELKQALADCQQDYDALRRELPWKLPEWPALARQLQQTYGLPEEAKRPAPVNHTRLLFDRTLENIEFLRQHGPKMQSVFPIHQGALIGLLSLPAGEVAALIGGHTPAETVEQILFNRRNQYAAWERDHPFDAKAW